MKVLWGIPAAVSRLYILIAELRVSYVSRCGLSSHRVATVHIDDGRAKVFSSQQVLSPDQVQG